MGKIEVILILCCLFIIGLVEFSISDSGYEYGYDYCGDQPYGVCEICECSYGYDSGYGYDCSYTDWGYGNCGYGGCSDTERQQTREVSQGDTSYCTEISRCVSDSDCGYGYDSGYGYDGYGYSSTCEYSSWTNGECGYGGCSDTERQQTREVSQGDTSYCTETSQCLSDSDCGYGYDYGYDSGYSCGYGYGYGYDYGCGYGSYSWWWGYSNYGCGYGYGNLEWNYDYRYICGYGNYYTGAVTGFAAAERENCFVLPKEKGTPLPQGEEGSSWECKMCDGYGRTVADLSKNGKPCKYIKEEGLIFKKRTVLDGKCYNGECKIGDCSTAPGVFHVTASQIVDGRATDKANEDVARGLKNKIMDDNKNDYENFLACKYPPEFKCPPDTSPNAKCEVVFQSPDVYTSISPKSTGEDKQCSGSSDGTFDSDSGWVPLGFDVEGWFLSDIKTKLAAAEKSFRDANQASCPSQCTVTTTSKMYNIKKHNVGISLFAATATIDYHIQCSGKYKGDKYQEEIKVDYSESKTCEPK